MKSRLFIPSTLFIAAIFCCNNIIHAQYISAYKQDASGNTVLKSQSELQSELNNRNNSSNSSSNFGGIPYKSRSERKLEQQLEQYEAEEAERKAKEHEQYLKDQAYRDSVYAEKDVAIEATVKWVEAHNKSFQNNCALKTVSEAGHQYLRNAKGTISLLADDATVQEIPAAGPKFTQSEWRLNDSIEYKLPSTWLISKKRKRCSYLYPVNDTALALKETGYPEMKLLRNVNDAYLLFAAKNNAGKTALLTIHKSDETLLTPFIYSSISATAGGDVWAAVTNDSITYFDVKDYSNILTAGLNENVRSLDKGVFLKKRDNKSTIITKRWQLAGCDSAEIWNDILLAKRDSKWNVLNIIDGKAAMAFDKKPQPIAGWPGCPYWAQLFLTMNDGKYGLLCYNSFNEYAYDASKMFTFIYLDCQYDSIPVEYENGKLALRYNVVESGGEYSRQISGVPIKKGNKYGYYIFPFSFTDNEHITQVDCIYDSPVVLSRFSTIVESNGKFGLLNSCSGGILIPCMYDFVIHSKQKYGVNIIFASVEGDDVIYQILLSEGYSYYREQMRMKVGKFKRTYPESKPYLKDK